MELLLSAFIYGGHAVANFVFWPAYRLEDWHRAKLDQAYAAGARDAWADAYSLGRESAERNGGVL